VTIIILYREDPEGGGTEDYRRSRLRMGGNIKKTFSPGRIKHFNFRKLSPKTGLIGKGVKGGDGMQKRPDQSESQRRLKAPIG